MNTADRINNMSNYEIYQFVKSIILRSSSLPNSIAHSDRDLLENIEKLYPEIYERAGEDALVNLGMREQLLDTQSRITNIEPISLMEKCELEKFLRSSIDDKHTSRNISPLSVGSLMGVADEELYFATVTGDSMVGVSIDETDVLIYKRTEKVRNNSIVIASINGNTFVKRIKYDLDSVYLVSENPKYHPIKITKNMDFKLMGEVCGSIRQINEGLYI